ncbi:hypothetical protein T45_08912 [Streptomyces turgidiscabies]|nr:hypothetical protein T45_08912 [Streptomyces turgidiscabies]
MTFLSSATCSVGSVTVMRAVSAVTASMLRYAHGAITVSRARPRSTSACAALESRLVRCPTAAGDHAAVVGQIDILRGNAADTFRTAGIHVRSPRELVQAFTVTAEVGQRTAPGSSAGGMLGADALLGFHRQIAPPRAQVSRAVSISVIRASIRPLISSRMGRTASTPLPAGSSRAQSRYFRPGNTGQASPQPMVMT